MLLAMSFGAGQVLNASNAASNRVAFDENPVTGVTLPAITPTTPAVSPTSAPSLDEFSADAPTTTAAPVTSSTRPNLCSFAAKIVAGGLPGPVGVGPADQLAITVTKPSWANRLITYQVEYALPARLRVVSIAMPVAAVADKNGTAHFTIPIGPESQGGVVSILTQVRAASDDLCDWHDFTVDYNGPQGLVGGLSASLAKNLSGVVDGLLR